MIAVAPDFALPLGEPEGRRWVVDLDLEKFFDRVNHDVLMSRVARRVGDERMLSQPYAPVLGTGRTA